MSYLLSLAPRGARRRALACSALVFAAVACNPDESTAPATDPVTAAPAAATPVAPTPELATSSLTAPGIAFGDFHLPTSMFKAPYSGSLYAASTGSVISNLNAAKSAGMRIVISMAGSRGYYTNSDGTFNLSKWKTRINAFRSVNLAPFVSSGTIIGHYLVDEPYCAACWGGRQIPKTDIEEMARYSKTIWSSVPTGVRSSPTQLGSSAFTYLDFAWGQYVGPLHQPSFGQSPAQYRDAQIAAAKRLHLGLVFGMNYLDGGDGSSRINGTYAKDPNLGDNTHCVSGGCYRYAMSPNEVKNAGTTFAQSSYACAVISWKYNETFLARSGMKDAMSAVGSAARNRSRTACKAA
jgi:hypothetical protein